MMALEHPSSQPERVRGSACLAGPCPEDFVDISRVLGHPHSVYRWVYVESPLGPALTGTAGTGSCWALSGKDSSRPSLSFPHAIHPQARFGGHTAGERGWVFRKSSGRVHGTGHSSQRRATDPTVN